MRMCVKHTGGSRGGLSWREVRMMKVTLEIPDSAVCLTYQCVYVDKATCAMTINQDLLDLKMLDEFRREDDNDD
jgi:hypothetical protein